LPTGSGRGLTPLSRRLFQPASGFQRLLYREWSTAFCPPAGSKGCCIRSGVRLSAYRKRERSDPSQPQAVSTRQRVPKVAVSGVEYGFLPTGSGRGLTPLEVLVSGVEYGFLPTGSGRGLTPLSHRLFQPASGFQRFLYREHRTAFCPPACFKAATGCFKGCCIRSGVRLSAYRQRER
jgi:hypothetical protein